jgi:hypothetical protein
MFRSRKQSGARRRRRERPMRTIPFLYVLIQKCETEWDVKDVEQGAKGRFILSNLLHKTEALRCKMRP